MKESIIQQNIISNLSALSVKHNFVFFAPMNENLISTLVMAKIPKNKRMQIYQHALKMGFLPGVSDILIFHNGSVYCIEVKTKTGDQSKNQKIFMNNVLNTGVDYAVVRSWRECKACLEIWGIM